MIPGTRREDALLRGYWNERNRLGWWLVELPFGYPDASPGSSSNRRFDAVVLPDKPARVSPYLEDLGEFEGAVSGREVELIEVKRRLNMDVVGQLLCGAWMFTSRYPDHGPLRLVAVVERADDAALRWFCDAERIEVAEVGPVWLEGDAGTARDLPHGPSDEGPSSGSRPSDLSA